jgi:hypothetical protein
MFKMGLDLGLGIALDAHALPKVQEIVAAIEGLRPGQITPSLPGNRGPGSGKKDEPSRPASSARKRLRFFERLEARPWLRRLTGVTPVVVSSEAIG